MAWVRLFAFGNGDLGMASDEIRQKPNPHFTPPSIKFIEAAGYPYQYRRTNLPASHPGLLAENALFLSGPTAEQFPELVNLTDQFERFDIDTTLADWTEAMGTESRAQEVIEFLLANHVLIPVEDDTFRWYRTIHCGPKVIEDVRVNTDGDHCS